MPQIVTDLSFIRRTGHARTTRVVVARGHAAEMIAYRRRLASLRTTATDTLRARVRRELRAAAAPSLT